MSLLHEIQASRQTSGNRDGFLTYIQPKSVLPNLVLTLSATIWVSACILNAPAFYSGFWKDLEMRRCGLLSWYNYWNTTFTRLVIKVLRRTRRAARHIRGMSELGCWMGVMGFWKTGWRNKPRVPTTHTITKIHRNIRSTTMATYFQSSITWKNTHIGRFSVSLHYVFITANVIYSGVSALTLSYSYRLQPPGGGISIRDDSQESFWLQITDNLLYLTCIVQ